MRLEDMPEFVVGDIIEIKFKEEDKNKNKRHRCAYILNTQAEEVDKPCVEIYQERFGLNTVNPKKLQLSEIEKITVYHRP